MSKGGEGGAAKNAKAVLKDAVAGAAAGCLEVTVMYPTEYVKTQLQLQNKNAKLYNGMVDCAVQTVKQRGFGGLYRGLSSLLLGTLPKASIRFSTYAQVKRWLQDENGKVSAMGNFIAGGAAGLVEATLIVTPVETMKTKLIHDMNTPKPQYRGLVHGMVTVVKQEGFGGIYQGVVPTIAKQMGNQSIRFAVYSQIKDFLSGGDPKAEVAGWKMMCAGFTAGFASVVLTMPFDVVKTRMQGIGAAAQYSSTWNCVTTILAKEGVLTLWSGMLARLPRVAFGQSIALSSYDVFFGILDKAF